jgi:hypothetical protein
MAKPHTEWIVLPHGQLTRLDDNVWVVTGSLRMPPMGEVERRMTVARLNDGRLVVYSAIALDEAQMTVLERLGVPAFLIVPNDLHRMDARAWRDRYPSLKVIAPPAARAKVESVVHVDATDVDFGDPAVRYVVVPGTDGREAGLVIEAHAGTTLVLNDLIFDLVNRPGLRGWLFKAIGMTGDAPHIPPAVKMRQVKHEGALRRQLEEGSRLPNLRRVIISHGAIITDEPAAVLGRVAGELAA